MANHLKPEKRQAVLDCLAKGMGIRAIARFAETSPNTVTRIADEGKEVKRKYASYRPKTLVSGLCACGCGIKTELHKDGLKKGQYRWYVKGHAKAYQQRVKQSKPPKLESRYWERKKHDEIRKEIVKMVYHDRTLQRETIFCAFAKSGYSNVTIGMLLSNGVKDPSYKLNDGELAVPPRAPRVSQRFEPYERKHIEYEAATDIKYLTKARHVTALDVRLDGGSSLHEFIPSLSMDPAEAMMWAEEQMERDDLNVRTNQFRRWEESTMPITSVSEAFKRAEFSAVGLLHAS